MRGPGRGRRQLERFFGEHDRGNGIVGALRFDEQPAQAEQPGILALRHGAESALRAFAVAVELGGLRVQQQRQRIVRGIAARDIGMPAGRGGIAVADRQQALGDGVAAAGLTAFAPRCPSRAGMRHSARRIVHASIAATMVAPSASANTGSEASTRQPPHDSATSPP